MPTTAASKPRLTKIICTISDLNCGVDFIGRLYNAGMNVVRLNTAHQSVPSTERIIDNIRQVSADIAIMLDTKGAEMRTCGIENALTLVEGQNITVKTNCNPRNGETEFAVNTPLFVQNIPLHTTVSLDEGKIIIEVIDKATDQVTCRVIRGGTLLNRRSVNVPGFDMGLPGITEQDRAYIDLAIKKEVDFIAHSFVRNRDDVLQMQRLLQQAGSSAQVIAKIENRDGIDNLAEIMDCAWGILIARGDLSIEIPAVQVPQVQKSIIRQCRQAGKPVILATHILGSMTRNMRPTQAEISDVANAVLDGVDALTLTGETAEGSFPVETTQTLAELCRFTETWKDDNSNSRAQLPETELHMMQVLNQLVDKAGNREIAAIIDETTSGVAVGMLSAARCGVPVIRRFLSHVEKRQWALRHGVYPVCDEPVQNLLVRLNIAGNDKVAILKSVPEKSGIEIEIEVILTDKLK